MTDTAGHVAEVRSQGYTILRNVVAPALVDELSATIQRLERDLPVFHEIKGLKGGFTKTPRVRDLLNRDPVFQHAALQPDVLAVCEDILGHEFMLSATATMSIDPGVPAQPLHTDDMFIPLPRPHTSLICNTIWAIGDFTEANGATRLAPGSHLWPDTPAESYAEAIAHPVQRDTIAAEMKSGDILLIDAAIWHGAGANQSERRRGGLAMSYCAGWIRQQDNFQLCLAPETARAFPPRLQELCGFGLYKGILGNMDSRAPAEVLLG